MAANKRKQDEKHLKMLREMVALPHNKQCFDCHQRGPTYVNMTVGSFVCTSCSGMLRGLNPPHRVKSISMTSFTPEEMEFLRSRGNDFTRKVWLGLYDSRSHMEPDSKDEAKIKDFMCQKFEKKRWYVAPTELMHEEARKQNTPVTKAETRPLRTLVGDNVPALNTPLSQTSHGPGLIKPVGSLPKPGVGGQKPDTTPTQPAPPSDLGGGGGGGRSGIPDLLGELGSDPFANPAPASQTTTPGGGFADFASFNSQTPVSSAPPAFPGPPASTSAILQPLGGQAPSSGTTTTAAFPAFTSASATVTTTTAAGGGDGGGDRYAALADLDSVFGGSGSGPLTNSVTPGPPPPPPSGPINWTGAGGAGTPSGGGGVFGMASSPAGSANVSTGYNTTDGVWRPTSAEQVAAVRQNTNPFLHPAVANPFGGGPQPAASVSNPFMGGQPATASTGFGQFAQPATMPSTAASFGQFGQSQVATPSTGQFGGFGQTQTSTASGAQFGLQNGSYGSSQQANWAFPAQGQAQGQMGGFGSGAGAGGTGAPSSGLGYGGGAVPGMAAGHFVQKGSVGPGGFGIPHQQGGVAPQNFGVWGGQTAAGNPFMSAGQPQAIPPRSNSTNPFL